MLPIPSVIGNGTQEIFYNTPNPLYVSLHGHPDYPMYWGSPSETGIGPGKGYNINIPLPIGTRDEAYLNALAKVVDGALSDYEPDAVVVSLGVDTFKEDVVGNFLLTSECYWEIGKVIGRLKKPTLFIMEGGRCTTPVTVNFFYGRSI
jgi:acetoin utilization deacetylase AcuC-like enzyme